MIVSNFELLIKRIATVPSSTPPSVSGVFRRVVQGYFLMISNLESDRSLDLYLKVTIPTATGNREMNSSNTIVAFDNGSLDNGTLTLTKSSLSTVDYTVYNTGTFSIGSRQTASVAVLPNVIPFIGVENPDLEIRGYIELKQKSRFFPFVTVPEASVLTTPETRGTFLDNDYPSLSTTEELDFDQISYGMPNASGKALNIIEAAPPIFIKPDRIIDSISDRLKLIGTLKEYNPDLGEEELDSVTSMLLAMKDRDNFKDILEALKNV